MCLCRSRILGRCNDARTGFRRSLSIDILLQLVSASRRTNKMIWY
nr:MAG TPA: hypothetical protein [Caudoviricetes sp.]